MIFIELFYTFFLIGLFGFGGGYGMLSMIQGEVVNNHHWLTTQEFTDVIAISQMTPGPIGVNAATFAGYRVVVNAGYSPMMGSLGSALATFAEVLPQFLLMIIIMKVLMKYWHHPVKNMIFSALRPTIVGLIAAATLLLMTPENFGSPMVTPWQFWVSAFLFASTFIGTFYFKINPIRMICMCGIAGFLLYY